MPTRYVIGTLATGRIVHSWLPVSSGPWTADLDSADTVSVTLSLRDPAIALLNLRASVSVAKSFLVAIDLDEKGRPGKMWGGPIWSMRYDRIDASLVIDAAGMLTYWNHRLALNPLGQTLALGQWYVDDPDPVAPEGKRIPNPFLVTHLEGLSPGGIAVSIVQQALQWAGGAMPIVLPAIETGEENREFGAADFTTVGRVLSELVAAGLEVRFVPQFAGVDQLSISWRMLVGTANEPLLTTTSTTAWSVTTEDSPVRSLQIDSDGSGMAGIVWVSASSTENGEFVARSRNDSLVANGFPLLELVDSSHVEALSQVEVDGYAAEALRQARSPRETWSFSVLAHPRTTEGAKAGPDLNDFDLGDFVKLRIDKLDPVSGLGDPFIPQGAVAELRVVGISGDAVGEWIAVKCAPRVL